MGAVDFRGGGRIFATPASQTQGYGNLALTPEEQAANRQTYSHVAAGFSPRSITSVGRFQPRDSKPKPKAYRNNSIC